MSIVEKLLLKFEDGELTIIPKEVSKHAPLNRVLDEVGHYAIEFMTIKEIVYVITYDPAETIGNLSKALVTKFVETFNGPKMTSLTFSDRDNLKKIVNKFMTIDKDFNKYIQ